MAEEAQVRRQERQDRDELRSTYQQSFWYKGRNVVERCFNRLKQWRGIAMRSDKLLRSYRAAVSLAATWIWIKSDLINTA